MRCERIQVRELLTGYGRIDGIWHDIFSERLDAPSAWIAAGYEKMYGEKFEHVPPQRLAEFQARTLANYFDEVDAIRRQAGQETCLFTSNGSGTNFLASNVWTRQAVVLEHDKTLTISRQGDRIRFVVQPNPVASVVLKQARVAMPADRSIHELPPATGPVPLR